MSEDKAEAVKGTINIAEANSGKMPFHNFQEVQTAWFNKQITFKEYLDIIRAGGGDIAFGELRVESPVSESDTIEEYIKRYKKSEISMHQLRRLISERGGDAAFWDFELAQHPDYKPQDSKIGFLWNTHYSRKGIFLQNVTKRVIEKMVDFVYRHCLKYDKDAFMFSDPRLIRLNMYTDKFIERYIEVGYKKNLIQKLVSIALFIMKEDVYYRAVMLKMINEAPKDFDISADEVRYFNRENPSVKETVMEDEKTK